MPAFCAPDNPPCPLPAAPDRSPRPGSFFDWLSYVAHCRHQPDGHPHGNPPRYRIIVPCPHLQIAVVNSSANPSTTSAAPSGSKSPWPALPRVNSATSGFFFCGISDDFPGVSIGIGNLDAPKFARRPKNHILSEPRMMQPTAQSARRRRKIPPQNTGRSLRPLSFASQPVYKGHPTNPSNSATISRSSGSVDPAIAPLPSGVDIHPLKTIRQPPLMVPFQHLHAPTR